MKVLNSKDRAFTLIELLVVIAIIGLLASIVAVSVNKARKKARDVRRLADMKTVQTALDMYFSDNDNYPDTNDLPDGSATQPADANASFKTVLNGLVTGGYISKIPVDPNPVSCPGYWSLGGYLYGSGIWENPRPAECPDSTSNSTYALEFCLENQPSIEPGYRLTVPAAECGRYCYIYCVK